MKQTTWKNLSFRPTNVLRDSMNDVKDRLLWTILQKLPEILSETQQNQWKVRLVSFQLQFNRFDID